MKLHIKVTRQVITQVGRHINLLHLPKIPQLQEHVLIEIIIMLLRLLLVHLERLAVHCHRHGGGILVHVVDDEGLADSGLVMNARAAVSVAAGPDLEVEGTIHFVLLCAEDGSKTISHGVVSVVWLIG